MLFLVILVVHFLKSLVHCALATTGCVYVCPYIYVCLCVCLVIVYKIEYVHVNIVNWFCHYFFVSFYLQYVNDGLFDMERWQTDRWYKRMRWWSYWYLFFPSPLDNRSHGMCFFFVSHDFVKNLVFMVFICRNHVKNTAKVANSNGPMTWCAEYRIANTLCLNHFIIIIKWRMIIESPPSYAA